MCAACNFHNPKDGLTQPFCKVNDLDKRVVENCVSAKS
jgi:hypothetical protein